MVIDTYAFVPLEKALEGVAQQCTLMRIKVAHGSTECSIMIAVISNRSQIRVNVQFVNTARVGLTSAKGHVYLRADKCNGVGKRSRLAMSTSLYVAPYSLIILASKH